MRGPGNTGAGAIRVARHGPEHSAWEILIPANRVSMSAPSSVIEDKLRTTQNAWTLFFKILVLISALSALSIGSAAYSDVVTDWNAAALNAIRPPKKIGQTWETAA